MKLPLTKKTTYHKTFKDKVVLITGGTGSFGQHLTKILLEMDCCKKVIIFSRDEWKQWQMQQSDPLFQHSKLRYFLGDIRERARLERAFNGVDYIVHTAALKQVPVAEYNPTEFVQTNVNGAMHIIDAAINSGVKKVIALSTDKAVNPVNLYGATKLCSDKIFVAGNAYVGERGYPIFSVVRYGNVLRSRGSIIPCWQQMIDQGAKELPITDVRMTRFWITLEQAVHFVMECFALARGGEIFVPKIPSMKIVAMAQAIAPHLSQKVTGIRPGEKLHEVMISCEAARHSIEYDTYYLILPILYASNPNHKARFLEGRHGKPLPEGFSYSSETNSQWLSTEELLKLL